MQISVSAPIDQAFKRTTRMLFKPFAARKWFVLGFCAFLSTLFEGGGGGGNFNLPTGGGGGGRPAPAPAPAPFPTPGPTGFPTRPSPPIPNPQDQFQQFLDQARQFVIDHAVWIVPVVLLAIAVGILLLWIRSRAKFMFLDGVVQDTAAVVEPWKRLRPQGNSFFRFELLLALVATLASLALLAVLYLIARPDIEARRFSANAITALGIGFIVGAPLLTGFALAKAVAEDFLAPVMYARTTTIAPAWQEFRRDVLPGHVWPLVLFYLMRIVLGIAAGILMMFGMCLTCLIAALPYLSSVVFLPIFVFNRCYSLYFLQQFGPRYQMLVDPVEVGGFAVIMPPMPAPPIETGPQPPTPPPPEDFPPSEGRL